MKILSIETSCDETAIALMEAVGDTDSPDFILLGNSLFSQINTHSEYGGVYPNLAKREHNRNLTPLLKKTLDESGINWTDNCQKIDEIKIQKILEREQGLYDELSKFLLEKNGLKPEIDLIVVTKGPGLAPALWVGISFAKALSYAFNIPLLGVNHMEGHIASVLSFKNKKDDNSSDLNSNKIDFPAISLLISGGHTEIVYMENWGKYKILGKTKDDAVGEAFDKVARMIGLKYPGGPQISNLAKSIRGQELIYNFKLPRPMMKTPDLDFSFSGLKTAVLYTIQKLETLDEQAKKEISLEFEEAVTDVLLEKTKKAIIQSSAKTLIIGGGVISNEYLRNRFKEMIENDFENIHLKISEKQVSTDNAIMIAIAGYINYLLNNNEIGTEIIAEGNLEL